MPLPLRSLLLISVATLSCATNAQSALAQDAPAFPPAAASAEAADQPAPVLLPQVNVTASPITTDQLGSFVPVTTLDREQIVARPGDTLGDTLFNEPGITGTTFAPGASRPIIRGLDNFRVRLQENGFASGDVSSYGEDHVVPLDPLVATLTF